MSDKNYEKEWPVVERFLAIFGVTRPQLSNPNRGLKKDSGVDVVWATDRGAVAFQVTEFHADRGLAPGQRSSRLRQVEASKAASGRPYTMAGVIDPVPGLVAAITEKVARTAHADRQRFPERILLIGSSLPHNGAVATFILDRALEEKLAQLNAATHELLSHSVFDSVYIFNVLSLDGSPAVYNWDRENGWRRLAALQQAVEEAESAGLETIRFLNSLPRLESMTRIVYDDGLGHDFFPALMAATPADRDLTPAEITSFEREYRRQRGL